MKNNEENKIFVKEFLKLLGIRPLIIGLGWIIRALAFYAFWSIVFSIIFKIEFSVSKPRANYIGIESISFLDRTSFMVILLTLFVYSIQLSSLIFLFGQIFNKSKSLSLKRTNSFLFFNLIFHFASTFIDIF
jgi:hypothetical protein